MKIEIVGTTAGVMIADGTTADVTTAGVMKMIDIGVMIAATTDSDGHHHTPHHHTGRRMVSYRWRRCLPWTMEARPTHRH